MIQQPEIWRTKRLKLLNDMQHENDISFALRAVKIGNKKIFVTIADMKDIIELLKRKTKEQE